MSSDARVTPLRDVANTPTRVGRVVDKSAPSSGKLASRATAKTPTSRSTHQRVNEKTSTTASSRKRALESDEEIVRLISAVTDAVGRLTSELDAASKDEIRKMESDFKAKWRSMPKKIKTMPLTEYADELLADGGEEALMELMDVNDVLREVDESLVREIVDEEALRAAAKRVVDHVASGTERAAAKSDVDERDPGETKTALGAIKDQAKTLMSRILQK